MTINRERDDYLVRATAKVGQLRCLAVRSTAVVSEALRVHGLSPLTTAALGRLLTGTLLLAADLKNETDSITLSIRSEGPIGGLLAVGEADGTVRGYCDVPLLPSTYRGQGKLDVGAAVAPGILTVSKDLGLGEPYIGQVELLTGEIAEDIAYYLAVSEQIPSVVALGVRMAESGVLEAGGLMVQMLPGAPEELIDWLEKRAGGFPDVTELMAEGFDPHQLLDLLMGDPEIHYLDATPVAYRCSCNRDRMMRNLLTLGAEELAELAAEPDGIQLECHFCDQSYNFSQSEVAAILAAAGETGPG